VKTVCFGTFMAARKTGLTLPLPLQFLAAWLAVWLGRVLQEQVDYLKADRRCQPQSRNPWDRCEPWRRMDGAAQT
jgi:hypothetical protein